MQVTFLARFVFVTFQVFNKRMKFEKKEEKEKLSRKAGGLLGFLNIKTSIIQHDSYIKPKLQF